MAFDGQLKPVKYAVNDGGSIDTQFAIERRAFDQWACVADQYACLGKDGIWYPEPLPSNRTETFIENTRFDSPEAALAQLTKYMNQDDAGQPPEKPRKGRGT